MTSTSLRSLGWPAWPGLGLGAFLIWLHATILVPFVLAIVLAYVLQPLVERLQRWRLPQGVAISLCLLMVGLLVGTLVVLLVPIVSELVPMLRSQLPGLLAKIWADLAPQLTRLGLDVPDTAGEWQTQLTKLLQEHVPEWSGALWRSVVVGGGSVLSTMGLAVLVPMLAFYFMLDWSWFTSQARALLPQRWRGTTGSKSDEAKREAPRSPVALGASAGGAARRSGLGAGTGGTKADSSFSASLSNSGWSSVRATRMTSRAYSGLRIIHSTSVTRPLTRLSTTCRCAAMANFSLSSILTS